MFATTTRRGILLLAVTVSACSTGPSSGGSPVSVSTATRRGPLPGARGAFFSAQATPLMVSLGGNSLVLTSVQLVAKHIEFKRAGKDVVCENDVQAETELNGESDQPGAADCEELTAGPVLLDLTLAPGATQSFSVDVPAGTFDEVQLHIHRVTRDDPADQAFLATHPEFEGSSIRVTGTYQAGSGPASAFAYGTDLDVEQELALSPPLTTDGSTPRNLTLFVDVSRWFMAPDGRALIDPSTAGPGGANRALVESNIKASFAAFEDENRDGAPDQ